MIAVAALREALATAGLLKGDHGHLPDTIAGVADDSRSIAAGWLFAAVRGADRDGHDYLPAAEKQGAVMALVDDASRTALPTLIVRDTRRAAAVAAAVAFGHPARSLTMVGVTGTNGKTTTVGILRHLLDGARQRAASIGTLGVLVGSEGTPFDGGGGLTTPGPVELQRVLRALVDAGVSHVAMEVSSHALEQQRTETLSFSAAVFTNLTRDHLDYHGTMEAYREAKLRLSTQIEPAGTVVVNADDPAWEGVSGGARRITFSVAGNADVRAGDIRFRSRGSEWTLYLDGQRLPVTLPLIGDFNVANALGAAAAAFALGLQPAVIAQRLSGVPQVPGRLEIIADEPAVLRDYAHTPDALSRALDAVRPFATGRLIALFGCGGDRDKGKRPVMGRIAEQKADIAIVTSDNPRTEDPEAIIDDIEAGMTRPHERITDRYEAIERAIDLAEEGDIVVLAGKGHETYQVRGTTKLPFDEREIVAEVLASRRGARG